MPTIKTYNDAQVHVLSCTPNPGWLAKVAIDLTQKKLEEIPIRSKGISRKLGRFILDARHGSVIEHASITFLLRGVSRSFLAQITRHRISSFTSASQHYQDYRDYPMVVHPDAIHNEQSEVFGDILANAMAGYTQLVDVHDIIPEEARQVLPNASAVNILWTVNARSLENFFYQRLCRRNVAEMRIVSEKIYREACKWWPELFEQVGPACFRDVCDQGKMTCGRPWKPEAQRQDTAIYCSCSDPSPAGALGLCNTCTLPVEGCGDY